MLRKLLVGAALCLALSTSAFAQAQFGTAAEATALLDKAVAELKANEADALAKFNKADGGFRDRDLYLFCYDEDRQIYGAREPGAPRNRCQSTKGERRLAIGRKSVQRHQGGNRLNRQLQFPQARHD